MAQSPFACPRCHGSLDELPPDGDGASPLHCKACGADYDRRDGIYRFLVTPETDSTRRFHRQYAAVRERDGGRIEGRVEHQRLPSVDSRNPRAAEWRIRRKSFTTLRRRALSRLPSGQAARIADLGAGNGWLSHRLSMLGFQVIAIDRLDDEADGLGACRDYETSFLCAQADFDRLPLASNSIDVVVLNGSLHYSGNPAATLGEARRVLVPGGAIVVMDSPMFTRAADGEAMVGAQLESFQRDLGIAEAVRAGVGFLTFDGLRQATSALGLRGRFFPSRGSLAWRLRRQLARLRMHRAPAAFGVWVAQ